MITHDLGNEFETSKIYFKQHSSCRWTHAAIDNALQLVNRHRINHKQIKKVIVGTHRKATHLDNAFPSRAEEAQYSIPYTVAAAIIHGCVGYQQMVPGAINDPKTVMLAQKIEVRCDDECERRFPEAALARLTIETVNGEVLTAEPSTFTKGDYQDPLTTIELEQKFRSYAGNAIFADQVDAVIEAIKKIEALENFKALTQHLCTKK
jgi:2-methylcitrate dehydratase PrpD